MAGTSLPKAGGVDSIPRQGAKILHTWWSKTQNIKQKYCNKFNRDLKNGPYLKKKKNLRKKRSKHLQIM